MSKIKDFKKMELNFLNQFRGGVENTSYKQENGHSYKDYKYANAEFNSTESYNCQCNVYGGTDKTNVAILP